MEWEKKKINRLQAAKERLIRDYIGLQDRLDEMNSQIFDLCCEIESINKEVALLRKTAKENGTPLNGKQDPRETLPPPLPDQIRKTSS